MPLKGIPAVLSPDLLRALAMMGHGDELVLADAHFPGSSIAAHNKGGLIVRADGIGIPTLLDAILQLINLDTYTFSPVTLMEIEEVDKRKFVQADIWNTYADIVNERAGHQVPLSYLERFAFYERAKKAFLIIQTGETAIYGNVILKNGIVVPVKSGPATTTPIPTPEHRKFFNQSSGF